MELFDYDTITEKLRHKRRKLDLTQADVAKDADVDKSTVSRLENKGTRNINYQTVHTVWSELEKAESQPSDAVAEDIMTESVEWITVDDTARDAGIRMRKKCFSQLPVKPAERVECVGIVTERTLMLNEDNSKSIGEIMDARPIEVRPQTSKDAIINLFKDSEPVVLVKDPEDESYVGIVTPADTF